MSCKLGYVALYDDVTQHGTNVTLRNDPNSLQTNQNGSLCQTYLVRDVSRYEHPGGVLIVSPDYLYGCEAAKRSLIAKGYP